MIPSVQPNRRALRATITAATLAACAPSIPPDFDGSYEVVDATLVCTNSAPQTFSSPYYYYVPFTIERDEQGVHTFELPAIDCPIEAHVDGDRLRIDSQTCTMGVDELRDIHGAATWTDDDDLAIEIESTLLWPPDPEYWPDGIAWDCSHRMLLAPLAD